MISKNIYKTKEGRDGLIETFIWRVFGKEGYYYQITPHTRVILEKEPEPTSIVRPPAVYDNKPTNGLYKYD